MKTCSNCNLFYDDNTNFCASCGAALEDANVATNPQQGAPCYEVFQKPSSEQCRAQEQECLNSISTRLKHERLAWKINGIVMLAMAIFVILFGALYAIIGGVVIADSASNSYEYYDGDYYYSESYGYDNTAEDEFFGAFSLSFGLSYAMAGITVILPIAIVSFVMAKKVGKYREKIYTDCTDAVNHATSVGSIVLGALFSEVALIFIIINFVLTKNDKEIIDRIKETQALYNAQKNI